MNSCRRPSIRSRILVAVSCGSMCTSEARHRYASLRIVSSIATTSAASVDSSEDRGERIARCRKRTMASGSAITIRLVAERCRLMAVMTCWSSGSAVASSTSPPVSPNGATWRPVSRASGMRRRIDGSQVSVSRSTNGRPRCSARARYRAEDGNRPWEVRASTSSGRRRKRCTRPVATSDSTRPLATAALANSVAVMAIFR